MKGSAKGKGALESKEVTRMRGRLFPLHYSPGKKLFQVVVRLSDAPGSFRSILDVLSPRVNLIGTSTYTLSDGTAMFSGFSEALGEKETAAGLRKLILSSNAAIGAEVFEGLDGLLIDSFQTGLEVGGESYLLFRGKGLAEMFDDMASLLGTGGETLIFEEGMTLGKESSKSVVDLMGAKTVLDNWTYFGNYFAARGWGKTEMDKGTGKRFSTIRVNDCFECSDKMSFRQGCNFFRGYLAGVCGNITGKSVKAVETRCRLKGADLCEFTVDFA